MADTNGTKPVVPGGAIDKAQLRKTRRRLVEHFFKQAQPTGDAAADAAGKRKIEQDFPQMLRAADATLPDDVRAERIQEAVDAALKNVRIAH